MKASKGARRKIAAADGEGGAERNWKPFSDAQKTKLTKVTEKLMAMKEKLRMRPMKPRMRSSER